MEVLPLGLHLFASLFLCTYQFSLSRGSSSIVVWLCCSATADFLFAYLPRLNQHTHTHTRTHTKSSTVHTRSHKGLNHPTLSCLALHTSSSGQVLFLPFLPSLTSSPLIVCAISFVATWPAACPIYQPSGPTLLPALVPSTHRLLRFASLRSFVCLCLFVDTIWLHCLLTISDLLFVFFCFFFIGSGLF